MKSGASTTKDNMGDLYAAVAVLAKKRVLIGIPGDASERQEPDGTISPINNAALGYIHETGLPEMDIPARPFLVPGVENALPAAQKQLAQAAVKMLRGDAAGAMNNLHGAGLIAASAVKQKMSEGPFVPLAERTIEARERRGVTRTDPLIDTASLLQHVTYVVR